MAVSAGEDSNRTRILLRGRDSVKNGSHRRRAMASHEVLNQPPPLVDTNLFRSDRALVEAVRREGAPWAETALTEFGETLGRAETIELGVAANRYPPELRAYDRF